MGIRDFLRKGSGLDLVTSEEELAKRNITNSTRKKIASVPIKTDDKVLKQLEFEVSRAIEKLEDIRDKLRVRRGY